MSGERTLLNTAIGRTAAALLTAAARDGSILSQVLSGAQGSGSGSSGSAGSILGDLLGGLLGGGRKG